MLILLLSVSVIAQQPTPTPIPSPRPKESAAKKVEEFTEDVFRIRPRQPRASSPADFNTPGVLQIEYGYGGYYRGADFLSQHTGTLVITFAATERIGFEADFDTVTSQLDRTDRNRTTNVGDIRLGVQLDIADESKRAPSFAVAYFAKLPTASVRKGLGSGKVDHRIIALFSKKIGGSDVDFNAAYLVNGRPDDGGQPPSKGFVTGGEFSLAISRDLNKKFNLLGEIYGGTKDADNPRGLFANGVLTYQINQKFSLNFGTNFGLTASSPRVGLTAGITWAIGNLYKKRK